MMGADLGVKKEQTNSRRGAGRDQETVISQGKVQGIFPIDPVEVPSRLLFDSYSSLHYYITKTVFLQSYKVNQSAKVEGIVRKPG